MYARPLLGKSKSGEVQGEAIGAAAGTPTLEDNRSFRSTDDINDDVELGELTITPASPSKKSGEPPMFRKEVRQRTDL